MPRLFHYCASSSFASIISGRSIWLSSLSLSNDTLEGRLIIQIFEELLSQSKIGDDEKTEIRRALKFAEEIFDDLGFCLSNEPDILSQWRGYADDGQGFSIGFSRAYLEKLVHTKKEGTPEIRLSKVLYEENEHVAALKPTFDAIKELADAGRLRKPGLLCADPEELIEKRQHEFLATIRSLMINTANTFLENAHQLKSSAFSEEAEWRLISPLARNLKDSASFRALGNRLMPYREIKLKQMDIEPIAEVYIGPKNITPNYVVEKFLDQNGFRGVVVKRSRASYR